MTANFRIPANFSDDLKDLIGKLLMKTPEDRPTAREAMEHRWFSNV